MQFQDGKSPESWARWSICYANFPLHFTWLLWKHSSAHRKTPSRTLYCLLAFIRNTGNLTQGFHLHWDLSSDFLILRQGLAKLARWDFSLNPPDSSSQSARITVYATILSCQIKILTMQIFREYYTVVPWDPQENSSRITFRYHNSWIVKFLIKITMYTHHPIHLKINL